MTARRAGSRRATLVAGAFTLAGGLTACAIGPDDGPRDIPQDVVGLAQSPSGGGAAATGTGRVYLVAPDPSRSVISLQAVARDVGTDARRRLEALLAGPNSEEVDDQFRSALPEELRLLDVRRRADGLLLVDISNEITQRSGEELIAAVAQIVFTANALGNVRGVELTVEGEAAQWPAGNGELRSEPLTVYDYPGLETSTQPAYPGLPR